jgi:hypothetical protein
MDNFNSFATINRLQSITFKRPFDLQSRTVTRLSLTLQGIAGTHGSRDWPADTGSIGSARHWKTILNSLEQLQHLELIDDQDRSDILRFSSLDLSDTKASIVNWILPDLIYKQLNTLCLKGFVLDTALVQETLSGFWPSLRHIILHEIALMLRVDENIKSRDFCVEHLQGSSWVAACRGLTSRHQDLRITLKDIASNIDNANTMSLHPRFVKEVRELQGVELAVEDPHGLRACDYNNIGYAASALLDQTANQDA